MRFVRRGSNPGVVRTNVGMWTIYPVQYPYRNEVVFRLTYRQRNRKRRYHLGEFQTFTRASLIARTLKVAGFEWLVMDGKVR